MLFNFNLLHNYIQIKMLDYLLLKQIFNYFPIMSIRNYYLKFVNLIIIILFEALNLCPKMNKYLVEK